ncbi:DUF3718 domain-containing protein [Neptunicella marina]|uniref:DUF3718 domain-containing protein n=1 Tax=Neptunicella marina TaxID=2125989 RepID=A0A8J6M8Z5_9ALTE|nr:DUF3718 domain-containing protein [Neptunicella marina]MBC3767916.1 DUF3718 domain-containing protein [Neptunicella marina]
MKKSIVIAALAATIATPVCFADVNEDLQNICTIVKNNDKGELRKKVRAIQDDYKLRVGDIYPGISCGGSSLIRYSMQNNATDVGVFIIKKMSKKDLGNAEADGQTIQQWAEANGFIGTEIGKELLDRIS